MVTDAETAQFLNRPAHDE